MWIFLFQAFIVLLPLLFFQPLIVAHRAGTLFPEICKIVVAGMTVGPSDVDAGPRRHVHLYTGGFSSFIETYGHLIAILPEG
jgi:hypothetical protein